MSITGLVFALPGSWDRADSRPVPISRAVLEPPVIGAVTDALWTSLTASPTAMANPDRFPSGPRLACEFESGWRAKIIILTQLHTVAYSYAVDFLNFLS